MKVNLKIKPIVNCLLLMIISFVIILLGACADGDSEDAAKPRSRAVINAGEIVPQEEIRIAEYLQYYDQYFPEPEYDSVGLDLRLGNNLIPAQGGMAWLQIGLQTKSAQSEMVAPLNLAIVIDRSGSMADDDKMPYVKQSLELFLRSLNSNDIVSIVAYSDEAEVMLQGQPVGDGSWIRRVVDRIQPGGATNMHAGIILGFEEVERNFDIRRNNRVMLLTDGIANRGVTDPEDIAEDALSYNRKGIYLTTIGLGLEFNDALLSHLADQRNGGYTFVDSAKEMDRVFRQNVESLKQRVASDVKISIIPDDGVRLIGLTGYNGTPPSSGATITLWPMSTDSSAVILAELQIGPGRTGPRSLSTVQLEYFDEFAQRTVITEGRVTGEMLANMSGYDPLWDLEILRNVTIQQMAEDMRKIDELFDDEKYEQAWRLAVDIEQQLNEVARLTGDSQMVEDANLIQRYQQTLADAVWKTEGYNPEETYTPSTNYDQPRPYRGDVQPSDLPEVDVQ